MRELVEERARLVRRSRRRRDPLRDQHLPRLAWTQAAASWRGSAPGADEAITVADGDASTERSWHSPSLSRRETGPRVP